MPLPKLPSQMGTIVQSDSQPAKERAPKPAGKTTGRAAPAVPAILIKTPARAPAAHVEARSEAPAASPPVAAKESKAPNAQRKAQTAKSPDRKSTRLNSSH